MCINISFSNVPPSDSSSIFPLFPHYFLKWNKVQKLGFHLRWRKPQEITPTITMRKSWIIYKILTCLGPIKNWAHKISKWTGIREGQVPLRRYGAWTRLPVPEHRKSKYIKVDKEEYACVHSISHSRHGVEATQVSTDRWMNKQNVAYMYNRTLFSLKKEGKPDTCCNMDEPWRHYVSKRNQSQKDKFLNDSTFLPWLFKVPQAVFFLDCLRYLRLSWR